MAIRTRRTRRQTPGRFKLHQAPWLDPYPGIPGTEPEKRVFAMLMQMGIYFIFQGQVPEFEDGKKYWGMNPGNYKPDFVLPEYKLVIDPFSPFHHSLDEAVQRDQRKVVQYTVAGYAYYHPWAVGPGLWQWDQYHNSSRSIVVRQYTRSYYTTKAGGRVPYDKIYQTKQGKLVTKKGRPLIRREELVTNRVTLYQGVNANRNGYRGINRAMSGTTTFGTYEMLRSIPEIVAGPRYKLTDPRDIKAKQSPGYRLGENIGAGADSVAAANAARARGGAPVLGIRYGTRRTIRRS